MKKLLVFDWDGTIVDSVSNIIECKQILATRYNLPAPKEETIKKVLGMPFEKAMNICFPTANEEISKALRNDYHGLMKNSFSCSPLFDKVKSTLVDLKSYGYILGIATAKYREEIEFSLQYHSLQNFFHIVACGDEYVGKPDPAMLEFNIKQAAVLIEETLFIGDTVTDIIFAKNAGVDVIAVTYGAGNKTELKLANPDGLVDNFSDIILWINDDV